MKCRLHKCKARCCYNIPFDNNELELYYDKIINPVICTVPAGRGEVAVTDGNPFENKCPFLREDYKCNIYENRPQICRLFGEIKELKCKFRKK